MLVKKKGFLHFKQKAKLKLLRLVLLLITATFIGCNKPSEGRYKISPPPSDNEKSVFDASILALSDAIRSSPSISKNYFKRATIYFENRDFEHSLTDINKAIELSPNQAEYLLLKSKNLKELGKYNDAYALVKQIESLKADDLDFYLLSTELFILKKDALPAKTNLQKAIAIAPKNAETHYINALYLKNIVHDSSTAILSFYNAINRDSKQRKSYLEVIDYLKNHKLIDSALVVNEMAIKSFPNEKIWETERGSILSNAGLFEQAWVAYNNQFIKDSTNVEALINMGNMRIKQKAYYAALNHYTAAQNFSTNSANLYYLTAFCNEKLRMYTQAQQFYIKALKLNPDLKLAQDGLNRTSDIINGALGLKY